MRYFFGTVFVLGAVLGVVAYTSFDFPHIREPQQEALSVTAIPDSVATPEFVAMSFRAPTTTEPVSNLLLLPHHLIAGPGIASTLKALPAPKRVILVTPDHFSVGRTSFTLSSGPWSWNSATSTRDEQQTQALFDVLGDSVTENEHALAHEHSITGLIAFLMQRFGASIRIQAIAVSLDTPFADVQHLSRAITDITTREPDTLVIFSIDASHYMTTYVADIHDLITIDAIESNDVERALQTEIDSPPTLAAYLETSRLLNKEAQRVLSHTNSARIMRLSKTPWEGTTSHVIVTALDGKPASTSVHTTLITDARYPVTSTEDRFYQGFDSYATGTFSQPLAIAKIEQTTSTHYAVLPLVKADTGFIPAPDEKRDDFMQKLDRMTLCRELFGARFTMSQCVLQ